MRLPPPPLVALALAALASAAAPGRSAAAPPVAPAAAAALPVPPGQLALARLPDEKLVAMASLLRFGDIALLESHPDGHMRQVTLLVAVAAPPKLVHDVVADVGHYPDFIRNLTRSDVTRHADGTVDNAWVIDYTVASFENTNRSYFRPDGSIEVDTLPNHDARYRWEFLPVPGGGTVVVMYGYVQVSRGNDLLQSILKRAPSMEHGLALSAMLVQARSAKARAEKLAGPQPPPGDARTRSPGFNFLLDRGQVAVIRSTPSGHLADISLLDRIYAPLDTVSSTVRSPGDYKKFIEDVKDSEELRREGRNITYRVEVSIPLCSWVTRYLMTDDGKGGIDSLGVDGDLKGSRHRFDLSALGPKATLAVLRETQNLGASSIVMRALFQKEPLFEHGINVAFGLVELTDLKRKAESVGK